MFLFVVILLLSVVSANDNINDVIIEDNSTYFGDNYQEVFDSSVDLDYDFYDDSDDDYYGNEGWSDDWMTTLESDNNTNIEKVFPISDDFSSIDNKNSILTPMRVESDGKNCVYFSVDQINVAANSTANYITVNKSLPAVVDINGHYVDMNDFLYLLCKSLNNSGNVEYVHFNHVSSSCGTNKAKSYLSRDNYTSIAASIVDFYSINNRNPKNINFRNITLNFDDTVYLYSRIVAYKYRTGSYAGKARILALYNLDYSNEKSALKSNTTSSLVISVNSVERNDGKFNFSLNASQPCNIYYTINGGTPTTNSLLYTNSMVINRLDKVKFFGVNDDGECTPVLSYRSDWPSLPYITAKPVLCSNGYEYEVNISTTQDSTIYYTINGSKPNKNSYIYQSPIKIHNYALLQFTAVSLSNSKKSNNYYYRLQDPTPYTTIINTTEVWENHQNVKIIGNKPGKIYYTRNGTTPTINDRNYTTGTELNLSVKTQVKSILVDENNKTSSVTFYQAPQIITPPVTIIQPLTGLTNNTQQIKFKCNQENITVYYTTDGTNPQKSNTTKTASLETILLLNKTTTLKYYTKNTEGYTSTVYTYNTPQHAQERPEITVYNTTGIYKDGSQRIMIQSNQPGTIHYTKIQNKTSTEEIYTEELTTDTNKITHLHQIHINIKNNRIYTTKQHANNNELHIHT